MSASLSGYIRSMGLAQGLRLYGLSKFARRPFSVTLDGYAQPIWIRPHTSDRNMFSDVLLELEYDIPLDPPPLFILDAGANVGFTSLFMAARHPQARIVAVEPEDSNFAQLRRNVAHLPQVTPVKAGLWPREAHLYVENPGAGKAGFRMAESAEPRPGSIRATTIPALMKQAGAERIDICKIDIEGGETELFADAGCHEWLSRTRLLVIELHDRHRPGAGDVVAKALARHPHTREVRGQNLVYRIG